MQGQEGPAWCFLRGHCSVAHTPAPTSCEISLSNQSHNHTSLYHNSMSLSLHWRIRTKILCPTDSDIYSLCVCDTCKAGLGKCSAVVSPPLARRLHHQQQQQQQHQSGPTRQRRGRRQGQSGETAGAKLETILTTR